MKTLIQFVNYSAEADACILYQFHITRWMTVEVWSRTPVTGSFSFHDFSKETSGRIAIKTNDIQRFPLCIHLDQECTKVMYPLKKKKQNT